MQYQEYETLDDFFFKELPEGRKGISVSPDRDPWEPYDEIKNNSDKILASIPIPIGGKFVSNRRNFSGIFIGLTIIKSKVCANFLRDKQRYYGYFCHITNERILPYKSIPVDDLISNRIRYIP